MNRNKALHLNTILTILSEVVTFISGLIIPRLMLLYFGSDGNGIVSSITQFLGFSTILRAGMGGAIRAALYKPLAKKDNKSIDSIMSATEKHMNKVGTIVAFYIALFAIIYPFIVKESYSWLSAFSLVIIIGSSTFVDNFFGIKYKILLQADQKYFIQIGTAVIANSVSIGLTIILIKAGFSIQVVKIGSIMGSFLNPIILSWYVKNHYNINWKAKPDIGAIKERWNAFAQQVAYIVNSNVDLTILTVIATLKDVSVYTVHFMVVNNIAKIVDSFTTGINSTFGDMIAKDEKKELKEFFLSLEWKLISIGLILYSVTAVMLPRFVSLYTRSIVDINYYRPLFALCMVITAIINTIRIPYQLLSEAAGRFRETRNGAIVEVIVNIIVSIIMTYFFGLIGVLIGTLVAGSIRTFEYALFSIKHILDIKKRHLIKTYGIILFGFGVSYYLGRWATQFNNSNYFYWIANSIISFIVSIIVVCVISMIFYNKYFWNFCNIVLRKIGIKPRITE